MNIKPSKVLHHVYQNKLNDSVKEVGKHVTQIAKEYLFCTFVVIVY